MYDPDDDCKAMIESLKSICRLKNVSLYALAKESGIALSTISYLMNGKTNPRIYTILTLCDTLGVTIKALFENEYNEDPTESYIKEQDITQDEKMLLWYYRQLSSEKRELLKIFMNMLFQYKCEIP